MPGKLGSGPDNCGKSGHHRLCECPHCKEFRKLKVDLKEAKTETDRLKKAWGDFADAIGYAGDKAFKHCVIEQAAKLKSDLVAAREQAEFEKAQTVIVNNSRRLMARFIIGNKKKIGRLDTDGTVMVSARFAVDDDRPHNTPWLSEALAAKTQLTAANKLRHDQILYSDKALTAARKALVDVEGFCEEIWCKATREQVHLARMEFDGPYARQQETTHDH